jgi:hypothetical protein
MVIMYFQSKLLYTLLSMISELEGVGGGDDKVHDILYLHLLKISTFFL